MHVHLYVYIKCARFVAAIFVQFGGAKAFDQDTTQLDVFETVGIDLVACASIGYNSTLFTYGQTASGKTHSVMGPKGDPGLIPRIVHLLFRVHEDLKVREGCS